MAVSDNDAYELLLQLLPPGFRRWMALEQTDAIGKAWRAWASGFKRYGFDVLDQLRRELNALEMVDRIPSWEAIMGLSTGRVARFGTDSLRRAQIIARRREMGLPTEDNILGSFAALCGTTGIEVLEHSRSVLTAANWYELPSYPAIAASADTDLVIAAGDNAPASSMGAQVTVRITHPSIEDLTLLIIAPDASQSAVMSFGAGAVTGQDFRFYWAGAAGKTITGNWTIKITDNGGSGGTVDDPAADGVTGLFVEGIGRSPGGFDGLAGNVFEWAVRIDEGAVPASTYSRDAARDIVRRWNPEHCRGYLVLKNLSGGDAGIWGDPTNSLWDGATWE